MKFFISRNKIKIVTSGLMLHMSIRSSYWLYYLINLSSSDYDNEVTESSHFELA